MNDYQKQRIRDLLSSQSESPSNTASHDDQQQIISHSVIGHNITQTYTINNSIQYLVLFALVSILLGLALIFF